MDKSTEKRISELKLTYERIHELEARTKRLKVQAPTVPIYSDLSITPP